MGFGTIFTPCVRGLEDEKKSLLLTNDEIIVERRSGF